MGTKATFVPMPASPLGVLESSQIALGMFWHHPELRLFPQSHPAS